MTTLPPPALLGLPSRYTEWRPFQDIATENILDSDSRFNVLVCPTGFGKSLMYMTAAKLTPGRTCILTSTKGLQTQLMHDFGDDPDVVDIRGRNNYACRLNTKVNCEHGICAFGIKCSMREEGGCFYFDQLRRAKAAKIVITNYAYWMNQNEYGDGIGRFDMLVLDEAHSSPDHLINHSQVQLSKKGWEGKFLGLVHHVPKTHQQWLNFAIEAASETRDELGRAKDHHKEKDFVRAKRLLARLELLKDVEESWVWEEDDFGATIGPIWPQPYAEMRLFLRIPKIVLTSATVVRKTANLLGIGGMNYEEYPHMFPIENRRLIHIPTVRVNYKNGEVEHRILMSKIDAVVGARNHFKGIIHTISYARRDMVLERSKFRNYMITHNRKDTEQIVRTFKNARAPCILVSPSITTGWDFPDDECRWQIILKLPYPNIHGEIIKARAKEDPEFTAYLTMQQLIQACGRAVRNSTDWCETFLLDNNVTWFFDRHANLMVDWFRGAYERQTTIPTPTQ